MIPYAYIHLTCCFLFHGMFCFCMHEQPPNDAESKDGVGVYLLGMLLSPLLALVMLGVQIVHIRKIGFRFTP